MEDVWLISKHHTSHIFRSSQSGIIRFMIMEVLVLSFMTMNILKGAIQCYVMIKFNFIFTLLRSNPVSI